MSSVVTVVETNPVSNCRYLLIGAPDAGLVGAIALGYAVQELQMVEVGSMESDGFPPVMVVHQGDPKPPLRLFSKGDTIALASEIPIDPILIPQVAASIVDWAKAKKAQLIISLSGIAVQNRLDIDVPAVYGVGSWADV